ncbi:hypothetical protein FNH47_12875 [Salmonella enterica subsp. houtenae]|uniref:Uncharacterized protein n=1 Tax=Salmonella houtenae TaxID=59205 RepID=A0A5Y2SEE7_SALHO|nr:hypothetical protein [Salmonella enterica subsp. houtenae]QKT20702.1 hypothetical protein HPG84_23725 [Salmonella enterica]HAU3224894.1 hypothetical protein [Salmonella enterica subsp. houtenae]
MKELLSIELNAIAGSGGPDTEECKRATEAYDYAHGGSLTFTPKNPAEGLLASGGAMIGTALAKKWACEPGANPFEPKPNWNQPMTQWHGGF